MRINKFETPKEWTKETFLYPQILKTNEKYGFDTADYSDVPIPKDGLDLCWQPLEESAPTEEHGRSDNEVLKSVVHNSDYGNVKIIDGDKVVIGKNHYLVQSVKSFLTYRLVTIRSTKR